MKKLFLIYILLFSFIGLASENKVAVTLKAEVLDNTNLLMEITALDNAGKDNKSLEFDFGDLVKGTQDTLQGTFQVRLLNSGGEVKFDNAPEYILIKKGTGDSVISNKTFDNMVRDVSLHYNLRDTRGVAGITRNQGTLMVSATTTVNSLAGAFYDGSVSIKITLANQQSGIRR